MKRIICSVIALLMLLTIVPVTAFAAYGYTDISSADQLRRIESDLGGKYRLVKNIDLSGNWEPIGSAERPFTGVLDGNGYTISGMSITTVGKSYVGLFANLSGSVIDLDVRGTVSGAKYVGGIAGMVSGGSISNSSFSGTVLGDTYVGGIAGMVRSDSRTTATIYGCSNLSGVYGNSAVGGIVGMAVADNGKKIQISGCANVGNVKANNGNAGGIIGYAYANDAEISVSTSYNNGTVDATGNAGGIIGDVEVSKNVCNINVSYCYNSADIISVNRAGAIFGYVSASNNAVVNTKTTVSINEFYNIGTIKGIKNALIFTAERDFANKTSVSKAYNTDYARESRDYNEYEGYVVNSSALAAYYNNITSLGFNSYVWTANGNNSYKFLQLTDNKALVNITEKPVIEGELTVGSRLEVKTVYSSSALDYVWYRNGNVIRNANKSYYVLKSTDAGCMISVRIIGNRRYGVIGNALSASVAIQKAAEKPFPPATKYIEDNAVELETIKGNEYRVNDGNWQDSPVFTGLEKGKTYRFYQRVKATNDVSASPASEATVVETGKKNLVGRGITFEVLINNGYYERICYCDSTLRFDTNLSLRDYEISWYCDGEEIANSESSTLRISDEFVGKKVVAVVRGINDYTGTYISEVTVPEHYSSYVYSVVEPTCNEYGYSINYCRRCGATFFDKFTAPVGHKYGDWTDLKAATCTEDGTQTRSCIRCGETETRTVYAHGHSFVFEMKKANCGEEGYSRERCTICNYCKYYDRFPASGSHSYKTEKVEPTCTEEGGTRHTCTKCGHSYMTDTIPANGHVWEAWVTVKKPTATTKGQQKRTCSVCKAVETREIDKITDPDKPENPDIPSGDDVAVKTINGKDYLFGLPEKCGVDYFGGNDVKIYGKDGKVKTSGLIATGDRIVILNDDGTAFIDAVAVIKGDIDGDGKVTATDYIKVRLAVLNRIELKDAYLYAAITTGGSKVTAKDYTAIRLHVIGKTSLFK